VISIEGEQRAHLQKHALILPYAPCTSVNGLRYRNRSLMVAIGFRECESTHKKRYRKNDMIWDGTRLRNRSVRRLNGFVPPRAMKQDTGPSE
jgi:hypothetical protein